MISGKTFRDQIISAANAISNKRAQVDELNVFPVPDGDTGTNMSMTINAAKKELQNLADDVSVEKAAQTAASAMLRGARGNSGVILSLLFRGFAKALIGKITADANDVRNALETGVSAAYKAVMKPTEGTMLTVARVASETVAAQQEQDVVELFIAILKAAEIALEHTPEQLPVLKRAGVVDAGGKGLVLIFSGMLSVLKDGIIVKSGESDAKAKPIHSDNAGKGVFAADLDTEEGFGYCTEFIVNKNPNASAEKLRAYVETMGDSVVVVDNDDIIKVHVHTEDPGAVISKALTYGSLTAMKIENMTEQFAQRQKQGKTVEKQADAEKQGTNGKFPYIAVDVENECGFVAVASGNGLKDIFCDLGVGAVVTGGQTMNPSTDDILNAVHSIPAKTVFVLPNNKNIILAAEQAKKLADRKVVVLPTRTVPQGISAMLAYDLDCSINDNTIAMNKAADSISTGQITFAARNSDFDGHKIKKGEVLALENGKLVFTEKDISKAAIKLAKSMLKKDSSYVTVISGCDVLQSDADKLETQLRTKLPQSVEISVLNGGQPVYYYIISVE